VKGEASWRSGGESGNDLAVGCTGGEAKTDGEEGKSRGKKMGGEAGGMCDAKGKKTGGG